VDRTLDKTLNAMTSGALTPRARLLAALRGQPAERVPGWMMRQAGRYLPEYQAVRRGYDFLTLCKTPEAAAEVSIQPLSAIGSDAIIIFNDILVPLELAGAQVEFDDRGPLIRNPIRSAADLARLALRPASPDEPVARTIHEVRRRVGKEIPILGFIGAPWTLATYWVVGAWAASSRPSGRSASANRPCIWWPLAASCPVTWARCTRNSRRWWSARATAHDCTRWAGSPWARPTAGSRRPSWA
jgi:hypothetical protein